MESPQLKQTVYSLGALCNLLSFGMSLGFPAILVPALMEPSSDIVTDPLQRSWLISMSGISILLPVLVLGPLMDAYGRRLTNFCVTVPIMFGWILTTFSYTLPVLFVARFLHSLGGGAPYFVATCVAEFASPNIRGVLLNLKMLVISVGSTSMHVFGYFLHWRHLALIGVLPSVIALIITYFWPESPDWLVFKGRYAEAENVFFSLRGRSEDSEREIRRLVEEVQIRREFSNQYSISVFIKHLRSKALWRPVVLLIFGIILPEVGGRLYFPVYAIQLVQQISGDDSKGFALTFVIDTVTVMSTVLACYLVRRYKRRHLILYPSYFCVVVLVTISALLFIRERYYESAAMMWLTLALLSLYFFLMTSTAFATSFIIMGELFPLEYRAPGTVINGVMFSVTFTAILKLTPVLRDTLHLYGMFFVYSICILLTVFYFHFDLPETKDRTLQDIADYFRGKSPKNRSEKIIGSDETGVILKK